MPVESASRRNARAAALAIAAWALARLFIHWPRIWDVGLWDESFYLGEGLRNAPYLMSQYEAFPLYSKFYHVLVVVLGNGDVPRLYMVGGLLAILLGLVGVGLGVWAASRSFSLTIASMAIVALSGALIWPRVVFLNLFIMGVGFAASALARGRFSKLSILALTCYLATFVRSEFIMDFYAALALTITFDIHALIRSNPARVRSWAPGLAALAAVAVLSLLWSFPILRGNARAMAAFGQHYGLRVVERRHLDIDPWLNWERIVQADFPGAKSLSDALWANPRAALRFFVENAFGLLPHAWRQIVPARYIPWGAGGMAMIGVALWLASPRRGRTSNPRRTLHENDHDNVLCAAILLLPPTLSIILVFPRDHYILQAMAAQMFVLGALMRAAPWPLTRLHRRLPAWVRLRGGHWGPIAIAVIFLLVARPLPIVAQPTWASMKVVHALPPVARMLESDGGLCTYAAHQCEAAWAWDVPVGAHFSRYLDENGIDAVAVSPGLLRTVAIKESASFNDFVTTASEHGWTRHEIPPPAGDAPIILLIRSPQAVTK